VVKESLAKINRTAVSLAPTEWSSLDPKGATASNRAWMWLKCREIGWFQTSNHFRAESVNMSYFEAVCSELFETPIGRVDDTNLWFGGATPASTNVYFINAYWSPWRDVYAKAAGQGRVVNASQSDHSQDLRDVREVRELNNIMIEIDKVYIHPCCELETRAGARCFCNSSFSGPACTRAVHMELSFRIVAISAVSLTSILLLIIGIAVWLCGGRPDDEGRSSQPHHAYR
jgi:hypothetical protein